MLGKNNISISKSTFLKTVILIGIFSLKKRYAYTNPKYPNHAKNTIIISKLKLKYLMKGYEIKYIN